MKILGHLIGAVVLEHDAAGADADPAGVGEQIGAQHFRRGAGELRSVVVLGDPEPPVAEPLGKLGQRDGPLQRLGRAFAALASGLLSRRLSA